MTDIKLREKYRCRIRQSVSNNQQILIAKCVGEYKTTNHFLFAWNKKENPLWVGNSLFGITIPSNTILTDDYESYEQYFWVNEWYWEVWAEEPDQSVSINKNGMRCNRCNDYFPYAQKNMEGGFVCFSCRQYPFYSGCSD